jgi:menaquinone-9 beta-reductase
MSAPYDAIVIGGGPSGATAAILLAEAGWRVAVVEKARFPRRKVCGEFISATTWPLLQRLGVADALMERAGPAVHRVGVYAGTDLLSARLIGPGQATGKAQSFSGCALGREHLDALLMRRAADVGAEVWQPCTLAAWAARDDGYHCSIVDSGTHQQHELHSRLVIAAHGSWESGAMPTQPRRRPSLAADLFGFKAHFKGGALPPDLMPLLAFPGGYGGMVHSDGGRVSLSCCIRRDQLERCRQRSPQLKAGAAVLAHIAQSCRGVEQALSAATLDGAWLSAGPLRTGVHTFGQDGIFAVGNAAAEAHPIVAEGISMAIQSATLLCGQLLSHPDMRGRTAASGTALQELRSAIRRDYEAAWRMNFSWRLRMAAFYAHVFMRPLTTRIAMALLRSFPALLTRGAGWSGKAQPLRGARRVNMAGT